MTRTFESKMLPLLKKVLDVVDETKYRSDLIRVEVIDKFFKIIDEARTDLSRVYGRDPLESVEYAIIALIDDLMVESPWGRTVDWAKEENCLEYHLVETNKRATKFFELAEEAIEETRNVEVVLVFLACVALGFRGIYRGKPEDLKRWSIRAREFVELQLEPLPEPYRQEKNIPSNRLVKFAEPMLFVRAGFMCCVSIFLTLLAYFHSVAISLK